jgi:hypothetical protein
MRIKKTTSEPDYWTTAPVRVISQTSAGLAAFLTVSVFATCRFAWALVEHMVRREPEIMLPPAQGFIVQHIVQHRGLEIACVTVAAICVTLLIRKATAQSLLAYAATCFVVSTAVGCYTIVCIVSLLFPWSAYG